MKKLAQPYAALYALRHPEALAHAGVTVPEAANKPTVYPDLAHAEDWDQAIAQTDWLPDEVLEAFCTGDCLMGSAQQVAERIRTLESYGVKNLYIRGFYSYELPDDGGPDLRRRGHPAVQVTRAAGAGNGPAGPVPSAERGRSTDPRRFDTGG